MVRRKPEPREQAPQPRRDHRASATPTREAVYIEDVARAGIERLEVICHRCDRHGSFSVARLLRKRPRLRMTDFLTETMETCRRERSGGVYDLCAAVFGPGSLPGV